MEKRILGTDLEVSAIGLGCMGMSHAYGKPSSKKEAEQLLEKAMELGCTFFDTAEVYGTAEDPNHNEKLLGEILKPYRNEIKIASKCGLRFDETATTVNKPLIPDGRPETIKRAIEGTLSHLQTDYLDLYYIHRIDSKVPIEETAGAMKELMEQGKILHWGLSEASEEIIRRAHKVCPITAIQNRYSMMYRDYEALFPVLEELKIGFVAYNIDKTKVYAEGYSGGGETMSQVMGIKPELFTAYLQGSSQWDGEYDAVVESRTPVYLVVGESDEYYGSGPSEEAYQNIHDLYKKEGLSEKQIDKLLVLDVKDSSYFKKAGITNQHGQGGSLFFQDNEIMSWLFNQQKQQ